MSLVIVSGASVCISPHKGDFISYGKSNMKIKDLSSSNNVAGEGMICWSLKDVHGSTIQVELKGYHMPNVEVRLLSPQVLIKTVGGRSLQTKKGVELTLDNGVNLFAQYCRTAICLYSLLQTQVKTFAASGPKLLGSLQVNSEK